MWAQDSAQEWRIEYTLVALHKALTQHLTGRPGVSPRFPKSETLTFSRWAAGKEALGACIKFIQKLSDRNDKVKAWLVKNKTISNEIVEHHQRLVLAEEKKEKEANSGGSRSLTSAFGLGKTMHK